MKSEPETRLVKGVDVKVRMDSVLYFTNVLSTFYHCSHIGLLILQFSIDDLQKEPNQTACWDGVRNYEVYRSCFVIVTIKSLIQARNHICKMKVGDKAFFYHSNCKQPGIVGIVEVSCILMPL